MKKKRLDLRFLYLYIPLVLLEIFFRIIQFSTIDIFTIIRVLLFHLFLSVLVCVIATRFKSSKVYFISGLIFILWFCIYAFVELIFKNFMSDYYSFGTAGDGLTRVSQYIVLFLSNARPIYYLCIVPVVVYVLLFKFVKFNNNGPIQLPLIICISALLLSMATINLGSTNVSILHTYATFNNKDVLVDKLGISHFFFRDVTALLYKAPEKITIDQEIVDEPVEEDAKRLIDDSTWKSIAASETNSNMQTIDNYLMNKAITQPNDMTGVFEGYNFIYFLVESGDYLMIDKDLTPNLYSLYTNSITFENHYTPLYSCGTGESEFVSYASIFPYVNTCTPNYCLNDKFPEALPQLFKNEGYDTFAIHNWRDEWYERKTILTNMGFDDYYDIDDIWQDTSIVHTNGWQSDEMLIEQAWKHIEDFDDKFMAMIITSTMHFPYDESTYWGDYYLDEISKVYPDWEIDYKRFMSKSMCLDAGIGYLIDKLKESGLYENTVMCFYCDHRPYWLDYDKVIDYTAWVNDRSAYRNFGDSDSERIGIYRSPFFVYNPNFKKLNNTNYCSTMDHVPTIANMFNLRYDPRLYIGKDSFDSNNTVIFTNGDWINEKGIYDNSTGKFTPAQGTSMPEQSYIDSINKQVQNQMNISTLILDETYFEKRSAICSPIYVNTEPEIVDELNEEDIENDEYDIDLES